MKSRGNGTEENRTQGFWQKGGGDLKRLRWSTFDSDARPQKIGYFGPRLIIWSKVWNSGSAIYKLRVEVDSRWFRLNGDQDIGCRDFTSEITFEG